MDNKEERYSAKEKGYSDKIYEVRFTPILERPEYQSGEEREGLLRLKNLMEEKDYQKYINNGLIRITQDGSRLLIITKNEMYRSILTGVYWKSICHAFHVDDFRVVSQTNGY
ncbi:hypothetical protein HMPREF3191_00415 [Veillonellaceae bacterium DNF00626]|jgi:hypothetical protein|nr:hypothetical protein HMPREF3191_00415 [Veillonellaceae bacterium DNF00626]